MNLVPVKPAEFYRARDAALDRRDETLRSRLEVLAYDALTTQQATGWHRVSALDLAELVEGAGEDGKAIILRLGPEVE